MSLREFMWLLAVNKSQRTRAWAGTLTDADVQELTEELRKHG